MLNLLTWVDGFLVFDSFAVLVRWAAIKIAAEWFKIQIIFFHLYEVAIEKKIHFNNGVLVLY